VDNENWVCSPSLSIVSGLPADGVYSKSRGLFEVCDVPRARDLDARSVRSRPFRVLIQRLLLIVNGLATGVPPWPFRTSKDNEKMLVFKREREEDSEIPYSDFSHGSGMFNGCLPSVGLDRPTKAPQDSNPCLLVIEMAMALRSRK
jgi:hypothetical protein